MRLPHNTTRLDALYGPLIESAKKIGGEIHVVKVDVNYNIPHIEALLSGAPETPAYAKSLSISPADIAENSGQESRVIVFIHFPEISDPLNFKKSLEWAKENHLRETIPQDIYALAQTYPELPSELSKLHVTIAETTGLLDPNDAPLLCTVAWENKARKAGLTLARYLSSEVNYFAFILPF